MILNLKRCMGVKDFPAEVRDMARKLKYRSETIATELHPAETVEKYVRWVYWTNFNGQRIAHWIVEKQFESAAKKKAKDLGPVDSAVLGTGRIFGIMFVLDNLEAGLATVELAVNTVTIHWMADYHASLQMAGDKVFWRAILPDGFDEWTEVNILKSEGED